MPHRFVGRFRGLDDPDRAVDADLIRCDAVGQCRTLAAVLEVRPVATDAQIDGIAVLQPERYGADRLRIDRADVLGHDLVQTRLISSVEIAQELLTPEFAARDLVEVLFHLGRERIVDESRSERLHQLHDRERERSRYEGRAALLDVLAILDRRDDARVRGRTPDAELLHLLHEARLRVARRRFRRVTRGLGFRNLRRVTLRERRQHGFVLGALRVLCHVLTFDVRTQEAVEQHGASARNELDFASVLRRDVERGRDALHARIDHLARDRALPDEFVQARLIAADLALDIFRRAEHLAGRADGLVRLLRVL